MFLSCSLVFFFFLMFEMGKNIWLRPRWHYHAPHPHPRSPPVRQPRSQSSSIMSNVNLGERERERERGKREREREKDPPITALSRWRRRHHEHRSLPHCLPPSPPPASSHRVCSRPHRESPNMPKELCVLFGRTTTLRCTLVTSLKDENCL